jgi:hypothetical protein
MKRNRRIDRARTHPSTWLMAVTGLAYILLAPRAETAPEAQDVEESAPDASVASPDEQQLEMIVRDRYPQLVTQRFAGVAVVTALFNHDGTLAATDLEISAKDPRELTVSELSFTRFGLKARDISYMGLTRLELPFNTVLIMYGGKQS